MRIRKEDYQQTLDYLEKKRWQGEEFVAFIDDALTVGRDQLFTFQEVFEAQEFCYEMSTDLDTYNYLSIRSVIRTMEESIRDQTILTDLAGNVDLSLMVSIRSQRLLGEQLNNNQKINIMDNDNYEYLSNQVKFSGFGEGLADSLKAEMQKEQAAFNLIHEPEFGNGEVKATLHFRRSEETGMVFFNKYDVELKQASDTMKQTFFVGKENNLTLKEAFNLMNGRAVYKEREKLQQVGEGEQARYEGTGEKYKAWVQLDFKETDHNENFKLKIYHDNYGFDLVESLAKLPIKELDNTEKKAQMIASLEKGNQHSITYVKDGEELKGSIIAVPQFKTIKMFDEKGKEIRQSQEKKQDQQQDIKQGKRQERTESDEVKKGAEKKKSRGKKM